MNANHEPIEITFRPGVHTDQPEPHITPLVKRAYEMMRRTYPKAFAVRQDFTLPTDNGQKRVWPCCFYDPDDDIARRMLVVPDLGGDGDLYYLTRLAAGYLKSAIDAIHAEYRETGSEFSTKTREMPFSKKVVLYTDRVFGAPKEIVNAFAKQKLDIRLINEEEMHKSLFISYGGPDEPLAKAITTWLKSAGIKTWFFPEDSLPGQKLHRMMFEGVNNHDRVLLLCSKNSLIRAGVLNELERVLERESSEGGGDILIPVTVDDFVFGDWNTERRDIVKQIQSRVVTTIPDPKVDAAGFEREMLRLQEALKNKAAA
jgi:hypothetical protein